MHIEISEYESTGFSLPQGVVTFDTEGTIISGEAIDPENSMALMDDCTFAMSQMPPGLTGIVVGAGQNAEDWHEFGWQTIDLLESCNPTYTADANDLAEILDGEKMDYIYAEFVSMHTTAGFEGIYKGEPAVGYENILVQAKQVLRPGGKLIIQTGHYWGSLQFDGKLECDKYAQMMQKHHFAPTMLIKRIIGSGGGGSLAVTWYAEYTAGV